MNTPMKAQPSARNSSRSRREPAIRTLPLLAGLTAVAVHGQAIIRRRRASQVRLEELAPPERADIIAAYLRAGADRSGATANADQARFYFGLEPEAKPADIAAIVDYYPVFRIHYGNHGRGGRSDA
jgi:hypothetical protein